MSSRHLAHEKILHPWANVHKISWCGRHMHKLVCCGAIVTAAVAICVMQLGMFLEPCSYLKVILHFVVERVKVLLYVHVQGHSRSWDFGFQRISRGNRCSRLISCVTLLPQQHIPLLVHIVQLEF